MTSIKGRRPRQAVFFLSPRMRLSLSAAVAVSLVLGVQAKNYKGVIAELQTVQEGLLKGHPAAAELMAKVTKECNPDNRNIQ